MENEAVRALAIILLGSVGGFTIFCTVMLLIDVCRVSELFDRIRRGWKS